MITKEEVLKIARLAHLEITEKEAEQYSKDLSSILEYVEQLKSLDVEAVEATTHAHGARNIFREDDVQPSFDVEVALRNVPDRSGQYIRVPIIQEQLADES